MGFDYSARKELDTDSESVRNALGIKILSTIDKIDTDCYGSTMDLYEFEMNGKVYVEYVKNTFTGYGNTHDDTVGFVEKSELPNVVTTVRSVEQGEPCKKCLEFDWTITTRNGKSSVKCNSCGFETDDESDFFLPFEKYIEKKKSNG